MTHHDSPPLYGPESRNAARKAMTQFVGGFTRGIRQGEFPKGDVIARSRVIVATLEGWLLLGNLYKDRAPIEAVMEHLERYVRNGFR